jgi:hypothetical protein
MKRISARKRIQDTALTGVAIHLIMSGLFPKRNDYGDGSFDELVPELAKLGITTFGTFRALMTKHRRALLTDDRSKLEPWEKRMWAEEYGLEEVNDCVRRQYWFAYPGLVRNAADMEFGELYECPKESPDE